MDIRFEEKPRGFSAIIGGLSIEDISQKVNECRDGNCSCDCSPEVMQKIENIEVSACQEGTTITITGDVSVESIAPMMQACLMPKVEQK